MILITILVLIMSKALMYLNVKFPLVYLCKISSLILLMCAIISFNSLNLEVLKSTFLIYGKFFHITNLTNFIDIFIYIMAALILVCWPRINFSILEEVVSKFNLKDNYSMQFSTVSNTSESIYYSESKESSEKSITSENNNSTNDLYFDIIESGKANVNNYTILVFFSVLGGTLLVSSYDLISMYLSIELQSFSVYVLATLYKNSVQGERSTSAGLKYFLLGGLSSCIILLGSSLMYSYTGMTNFDSFYTMIDISNLNILKLYISDISMWNDLVSINNDLFISLNESILYHKWQIFYLGIVFLFVGYLFKISAAPFHNWAPDVYDNTPTIVTIWLTIMPKLSILFFILEFYIESSFTDVTTIDYEWSLNDYNLISNGNLSLNQFINLSSNNPLIGFINGLNDITLNLLLISSLLSLFIGSLLGLVQTRLKRLLAFSTISHIGFILLTLSLKSVSSISAFLFYIIQYSITNLNIFLIIIALSYLINRTLIYVNKIKIKDIGLISELKGQFFKNPLFSIGITICLYSFAGIPPFVGFFSKLFVLSSAIQESYYFVSLICIIMSVISTFYYLNFIKILHLENNNSSETEQSHKFNNINSNISKSIELSNKYLNQKLNVNFINFKDNKDKLFIVQQNNLIINNYHIYLISMITYWIVLFIISPSFVLNSTQLLSIFTIN